MLYCAILNWYEPNNKLNVSNRYGRDQMLDFTFSEEQNLIRESARQFCQKEIAPKVRDMISARKIPDSVVSGLARMNFLGMTVPQRYGGMGADAVTTGIVAEEIARADPTASIPVMFLVDNAWSYLLSKYGTDELKESLLPDVARGRKLVGIASTEPDFGSDIGSMKSYANVTEDGFEVHADKSFISLVRDIKQMGGGYVTVVKTDRSAGTRGTSLLYLPHSDNLEVSYLEEMGREGSSWGAFKTSGEKVPKANLIGELNKGFHIIHEGFEFARGLIAVIAAATAQNSIENAIAYMKNRKVFGTEIAKFQGLQFDLAGNVARMEAAMTMGYKSLWIYDREQKGEGYTRFDVSKNMAIAKLISTTWAFDAINDALQWQGAYGYSKDCPEEWALRGVRSFLLAEGSREIMKVIIARETLGKEYMK